MHHYYSGTAVEKLSMARTLYQQCGPRLSRHKAMQEALEHLRQSATALTAHMRSMGMDRLCCHCAARPGGGCCSASMADNTDSLQILINLLLDVVVDLRVNETDDCCFLGQQGCLFMAKPFFCLNYNCTHILNKARAGELAALYRHTAAALSRQTQVELLLLKELHTREQSQAPHLYTDAAARIERL